MYIITIINKGSLKQIGKEKITCHSGGIGRHRGLRNLSIKIGNFLMNVVKFGELPAENSETTPSQAYIK